jgi:hypothetical protein
LLIVSGLLFQNYPSSCAYQIFGLAQILTTHCLSKEKSIRKPLLEWTGRKEGGIILWLGLTIEKKMSQFLAEAKIAIGCVG